MSTKFKLYFCVSAFCILHSALLFAQGPAWWAARGVVDTNLQASDYATITLGQLKWIATNACAEMNAYFGAATNVTALVGSFSNANNYYAANIGQVKYVAQPFYDRLHDLNLTNTLPANMPGYYPWGNAQQTNDYALANIGQVKYVFSFDSGVDSDNDGLVDWLEVIYGTDPYDPDTDGDGLSDGAEVDQGSNPLDPDSTTPEDLNALREAARGRIVYHWRMVFGTTPTFTNTAGSQADLDDMRDCLNALSGKNY